jgi:hypothetical protein
MGIVRLDSRTVLKADDLVTLVRTDTESWESTEVARLGVSPSVNELARDRDGTVYLASYYPTAASETALVSELENTPEGMPEAAVAAYRQRLRARFTELYTERTTLQTQLDTFTAPSDEPASDPALLDELPTLGDIVTNAPAALIERLLAIFDLSAVHNRDKHQLTIHATITPAAPQAVRDLLLDPRADHNQKVSDPGPTRPDQVSHTTGPTGSSPRTESASANRWCRRARISSGV